MRAIFEEKSELKNGHAGIVKMIRAILKSASPMLQTLAGLTDNKPNVEARRGYR